jgi:hypothetical protein
MEWETGFVSEYTYSGRYMIEWEKKDSLDTNDEM